MGNAVWKADNINGDVQDYLSIYLIDTPVDTDTKICKTIKYCLDEQVLANYLYYVI